MGPADDPREAALDALYALRWYRRGHARPPGQGRLSNWYMGVLGVLTFASMFFSGIFGAAPAAACPEYLCQSSGAVGSATLPLALLTLGAGIWLTGFTGPMGASAPRLTWLLQAPADRGMVLRGRYWVNLGIAAALGAAAAVAPVLATLDPVAGIPVARLGWMAVTGAAAGTVIAAVGTVLQTSMPVGTRLLSRVGLGLATLGALAGTAAGFGLAWSIPELFGPPVLPALVACGVAATVTLRGRGALPSLSTATLRRGGQLAGAFGDAALAMDAAPATNLLSARRAESRGRHRSRQFTGTGTAALLRSDARRLARRPGVITSAVLLVPLPMLVATVIDPLVAIFALGLAAAGWTRSAAAGYLAWAGSSGLRRMLGLSAGRAATALLALPTAGLLLWCATAVWLTGFPAVFIVAFVACGLASTLDAGNAAKPADVGALVSTPMGAVPVGLVQQVTGGAVLIALCVAPLLLTTSPLAVVVSIGVLAQKALSKRRPR